MRTGVIDTIKLRFCKNRMGMKGTVTNKLSSVINRRTLTHAELVTAAFEHISRSHCRIECHSRLDANAFEEWTIEYFTLLQSIPSGHIR